MRIARVELYALELPFAAPFILSGGRIDAPRAVPFGVPEDRRAETLTRRVYEALQRGYQRVKIKVARQWDEVAVRAARAGMAGTYVPLTVDANGAYRWPEHEAALRALDEVR